MSLLSDNKNLIRKTCKEGISFSHNPSLKNRTPQRPTSCISLLTRNAKLSFLYRIVRDDEKWVLQVNRKEKRQELEQNKKQRQNQDSIQ